MRAVAGERKKVRTALKLPGMDLRPALGFATPGRMPSPLRWKIVPHNSAKLAIRIFAMPHALPVDSKKSLTENDLSSAWKKVCNALDESSIVNRAEQ
jgi:CRISPR-associated protein Cmr1